MECLTDESSRVPPLSNSEGSTSLDVAGGRQAFQQWLAANRREVRKMPIREVLAIYGGHISVSAAYRIAVGLGLRGKRRNASRYDKFWATINWRLPDTTLSAIWGVGRGNIRQRRVRLGVDDPSYDGRLDQHHPGFQEETAAELRRFQRFSATIPH